MKKTTIKFFLGAIAAVAILSGCGATSTQGNHDGTSFGGATQTSDGTMDNKNMSGSGAIMSIPVEEFATKIASEDYVVLDVRTPEEYASGRLAQDAVNVNFYDADFRDQIKSLSRDAKYLVYCRSGNRSGETLKIMKELGFAHVEDLDGGINAWQQAGKTLIKN